METNAKLDDMDERSAASKATLYESDFYSWTQEQARLLRSGRLDGLDVANVLEEIETLGRSERASLKSAYRLVCLHLLKMKYQPEKTTRSWSDTIDRERAEIVEILAENPSLRSKCDEAFRKAYALARKDAARETRLRLQTFPEVPPFDRADCDDTAFLPGEVRHRAGDPRRAEPSRRRPRRID